MARSRSLLLLGLLLLAAVAGLSVRQTRTELLFFLPSPEPREVGPVIVQSGPAGMAIYFGLRAADGRATRADGQAELVIRSRQNTIYRRSWRVRGTDFAQAQLPGAPGLSWLLVYGLGWLSYRDNLGSPPAGPGSAQITFTTPQGRVLQGAAALGFPG